MNKEQIQQELLKLPDGAWHELEEVRFLAEAFQDSYRVLIRKRMWLQKQLEPVISGKEGNPKQG